MRTMGVAVNPYENPATSRPVAEPSPAGARFERISIVGLGYIGLPTAAMFASRRKTVIGVDVTPRVIDTINRGEIHIVEPALDMIVRAAVQQGYLHATSTPEPADAFLIAVPTPFKGRDHQPDLSYVECAAKTIAPMLRPGNLVVLESTSPVGATEKVAEWLAGARPDLTFPHTHGEASDIRVAHCPERVLPGQVIRELVENDRVIGGMTPKCAEAAVALYRTFVQGACVVTNARTAEMCKLTENSFRDVNIAFANELSTICDEAGVDVWELISLANRHPRVNILQPGPGVGGHCIAVDPWFIASQWPREARMIRTAREVNDSKPKWIVDKARREIAALADRGKPEREQTVVMLGLTFKANIDDLRGSPALEIADRLRRSFGGTMIAAEPNIGKLPPSLPGVRLAPLDEALAVGDVFVLAVAHRQFEGIASRLRPRQRLVAAVAT
ncbi:UDP-N-acetyl-D-mannosamine dehydrogenase [Aquamicrobium sp. LC103]|uniref:UDP-N-acetyl-D-mannosamine dehydrogenase n=1 Tax=Aquamicrobium sp. LC103 TaxID=1120658 RepID=UPI000A48D9E2|nr:UDP-N-acetyl-D-mannosamine dehydrogenase [Aquamicrobium sp. LC103]